MSRAAYLRFLALSLVSALLLSAVSLLFLNRISDIAADRHRDRFLLFFAQSIEEKIASLSDKQLHDRQLDLDWSPPPPPFPHGSKPPSPPPGFPPPPFGRPGMPPLRGPANLWLVSDTGSVVSSNVPEDLPVSWQHLKKPNLTHAMTSHQDFFRLQPGLFVIKLEREPALFLVARDQGKPLFPALFGTQAAFTFGTITIALILSLSFTFIYLRRKSQEARMVLHALEQGDLQARFRIKRIDEAGGLLMDFNRMAGEIEKLVNRVHASESARSNLLQELGHDLRTPLTSLTTSFETLKIHHGNLTEQDREDLFQMIGSEIRYFRDLLEQLMIIASLDEPHYKNSTEMIDLPELVRQEIKVRQTRTELQWSVSANGLEDARFVSGDPNLILRLFRNAFDNAARFAQRRIEVQMTREGHHFEVLIRDDGPGLTDLELTSFGVRRSQRRKRAENDFSLGLGSVIMTAIAKLHGGEVSIANAGSGLSGAELKISLPLSQLENKSSDLP